MKHTRKLDLKRETLGGLGNEELGQVAGASHFCTVTHTPACDVTAITCITLPVVPCVTTLPTVEICIQTGA